MESPLGLKLPLVLTIGVSFAEPEVDVIADRT